MRLLLELIKPGFIYRRGYNRNFNVALGLCSLYEIQLIAHYCGVMKLLHILRTVAVCFQLESQTTLTMAFDSVILSIFQ